MKLFIKPFLLLLTGILLYTQSNGQTDNWTAIRQKIDAKPYAGKNLKLTAAVMLLLPPLTI